MGKENMGAISFQFIVSQWMARTQRPLQLIYRLANCANVDAMNDPQALKHVALDEVLE